MRFVSHRFPYSGTFFDIGCGEGANARELWSRGYRVFSIDKDSNVKPPIDETPGWHVCANIREYDFKGPFDLIYDINTLCHVDCPPWDKIKNALRPEGVFFSICPHYLSPTYIADGKEFTRTYSELGLRQTLEPYFFTIRIYERFEPDFKENYLRSWIVEARP